MAFKAPVAPVPFMEIFGGFAADRSSYYGDLGGVFAVNRNLLTDGWLIRINGGAGEYTYQRTAALNQRATFETGEVMAGYQWYLSGGARFSAYFGAYAENHDNTDPLALIHGSKGGVKGQVEYYTPLGDRAFAFVMANGNTVWNGYFAIGKLGWRATNAFSIGPELITLGNDRFGAVRLGPWIGFKVGSADVFVSGGYSWDTKDTVDGITGVTGLRNHDGGYGTLHVRQIF